MRKINFNKQFKFYAVLWILFLPFFACCDSGKSEVKIANWNVQTFFDANNDGTEYSEFAKSKTWGEEMYKERLKRLCSVIKKLDADIFIMEELENSNVLFDISNFLAGEWNPRKIYRYACFSKNEGGAIGCGVLSRIPLQKMNLHSLDIRTENEKMPRTRPLSKIEIKLKEKTLSIFVNHWKSKSGGEEKTEKWRNREECVLSFFMSHALNEGKAVFAVGDFNRDINDFCVKENGNVLLRAWHGKLLGDEGLLVKSTWFDENENLIEPGSYYFREEWSRIDNIFYSGNIEVEDFFPAAEGFWCNENSIPYKYSLWNGRGYSDHLPLVCKVRLLN